MIYMDQVELRPVHTYGPWNENEFIKERILNLSHQSLSNLFTIKICFTYIHKILIAWILYHSYRRRYPINENQ